MVLTTMDKVEKQRKNNEGGVTGKGWKPGQSGNPKGRPKKGTAIADILNTCGNTLNPETGETNRETMLKNVYNQAIKRNPDKWSVEFIANRTEGRAIERSADVSDEWKELVTELYKPES